MQNHKENTKGPLIAFEGIDGCGKSTQAQLLVETLRNNGVPHLFVREPGSTETAEAVREILLHKSKNNLSAETELFLYLAARADLYCNVINPALSEGKCVVSDRCFWSTVAYQGAGLDLGMERSRELSLLATGSREPDLVFLLDLSPGEAAKRFTGKGDRIESRGGVYPEKVRNAFLKLASSAKEKTFILNGTEPVEKVRETVRLQTGRLLNVSL